MLRRLILLYDFWRQNMTVRFFSLRAFPAAFTVVRPTTFFDLYPLANVVAPKSREEDLEDVPEAGKRFALRRVGLT